MNDELAKLLEELDQSKEKTSEHSISSKINIATKEDQSLEAIAERLAFGFCEDYLDKQRGTYFCPMMVWVGEDGKTYENPSISLVDSDVVEYWKARSLNTKNSLMKSRYSGLVWDLSEVAIGEKPDHKIAIEYVNALLDLADKDLCEHPTETITKIARAYKVASALNNYKLIKKALKSLLIWKTE